MRKISTKIILSIAFCVVISSIIVGTICVYTARNQVVPEAEGRMEAISKQYANEIDITYIKYQSIVEGLEQYILNTMDPGRAYDPAYMEEYMTEIRYYLLTISKTNDIASVYVYANPEEMKGIIATKVNGKSTVRINNKEEYTQYQNQDAKFDFFYQAQEKRKAAWLNPVTKEELGKEVITYYTPIYMSGKLQAVIGMDIAFDDIRSSIQELLVYETGYAFLLSDSYEFLVHDTLTIQDSMYSLDKQEIISAMDESPNGFVTTTDETGVESYLAFSTLANGVVVCVSAPVAEVTAGIDKIKDVIGLIIIITCMVCCIMAFGLGRSISNPIVKMIKDLDLMQKGNFTGKKYKRYIKKKNEIGKLARAIEVIQDSMKEVMGTIGEGSGEVNQSVVHLAGVMGNLTDQVANISSVSEQLSASMDGTMKTAENLSEMAKRMSEYVGTMEEKNQEGNVAIQEITARAGKLNEDSISSSTSTEQLIDVTKEKMEKAIRDTRQVEKINELTDAILNIADQTALLSLNASIEAARAGESGRGFSVVADEIRKLADSSEATAIEIQSITDAVNTSVQNLCECAGEVLKFLESGMRDTFKKLVETSEQYNGDAEHVQTILDEFSLVASKISTEINLIFHAFDDLKAATAEGADGTNEVARSAETLKTNTMSLNEQGTKLEKLSGTLQNAISKFTV